MKRLSPRTTRALKALHLVGVTVWVSGVVCTGAVVLALSQQASQEGMLALLSLAELADYLLIIPGATACYLLGTVYGLFTAWGFVRHRWVAAKWVLYNIACIPAMVLALPTVKAMRQLVLLNGAAAPSVPGFQEKLVLLGALSGYILVIATAIALVSVYKPFRKKKNTETAK
ncbi:MAG: hypothetical protein FWG23_00505 [Eggerthellaceae bacterium]|nr:hypothetical protein [Eggerthellaceae bacterium]